MEPEFLTIIDAKTALETPQILLSWEFANIVSPIASIEWLWDQMIIRRSKYRYPESITEGTSILSENYSPVPTVHKGDVDTLEGMLYYYYSLFLQYKDHSSSLIDIDQDISRICTDFTGVCYDTPVAMLSGLDGTSNASSAVFTIPAPTLPALGFRGSNVTPGSILHILAGLDLGYHIIKSVDSDTQITLDIVLTDTNIGGVNYEVITDHVKFWITGTNFYGKKVIYRYDTRSQMVDYKIDVTNLLQSGEVVTSIPYANIIPGFIGILTNKRYLQVAISESPILGDIVNSWNLTGKLKGGYIVKGSCLIPAVSDIAILDSIHLEIVIIDEATGTVVSTTDLSGLNEVTPETITGLSLDANDNQFIVTNKNYSYSFLTSVASPIPANVDLITYTRNLVNQDITFYTDIMSGDEYIVVIDSYNDRLRSFGHEIGRGYLWQQPFVSDKNTIALFHLDDDGMIVIDSSGNGNDGSRVGMLAEESGKFDFGYMAIAVGNYLDITSIAGDFDGTEGSLSIWFKASNSSDLSNALMDRYLIWFETGTGEFLKIGIVSGNLTFEYTAGGVAKIISSVHPALDTNWHNYKLTWSHSGDQLKAYVDGIQFGVTQSSLGVWAASLSNARIGGATNDTLLGYYDECRISNIARIVHPIVSNWTTPNKMYALSGRDYNGTYDLWDPLGFNYKDEFYSDKFLGGDFLIRNDYERYQLYPPNKIALDGTILFRDTVLPVMGDLGRLSRLVGCMLDRICDDREALKYILTIRKCGCADLQLIANFLGIPGLDDTTWNMDQQQRYVDFMRRVLKKGGTMESYQVYAKLLGFSLIESTLYARRSWDTVIDPIEDDIYLDEMGSMDTFDESYPLAHLRFKFFKESFKSNTGSTSVAANRILSDSFAHFKTTVGIGDLIRIYDISTPSDNDYYTIVSIISDTQLIVNKNWLTGSHSGLSYTASWLIPKPDPYVDFLLARFEDIAPDAMLPEYWV